MRGGAFLNGKVGRVGFRKNSTVGRFPPSSLRFLSPTRGTEGVVKTFILYKTFQLTLCCNRIWKASTTILQKDSFLHVLSNLRLNEPIFSPHQQMTFAMPFFADGVHFPQPHEQTVRLSHLSEQEYFLFLMP